MTFRTRNESRDPSNLNSISLIFLFDLFIRRKTISIKEEDNKGQFNLLHRFNKNAANHMAKNLSRGNHLARI